MVFFAYCFTRVRKDSTTFTRYFLDLRGRLQSKKVFNQRQKIYLVDHASLLVKRLKRALLSYKKEDFVRLDHQSVGETVAAALLSCFSASRRNLLSVLFEPRR